jgi:excisionase family DNA binding protein
MSPSQVAQQIGASRRTVMRAIEAKELKAFRDNRNHWKITPQALEEWANAQCAPSGHLPTTAHTDQPPQSTENAVELEAERAARRLAEIEAAELRGKLSATEAERDRLHGIVQDLTGKNAGPRSWWPWRR